MASSVRRPVHERRLRLVVVGILVLLWVAASIPVGRTAREEPRGWVPRSVPGTLITQWGAPAAPSSAGQGNVSAPPPIKAVAHRAGARVVKASRTPRASLDGIGVPSGEPTLGITKDGTVFVTALDGDRYLGGTPHLVRSADGGTWQDVTPPLHKSSLDPYLHVDPETSRIFSTDLTGTCATVSFSDDLGETWTATQVPCHHTDYQKLFSGPPAVSDPAGYPNVVYFCAHSVGLTGSASAATGCSKSVDGGKTFLPTEGLPFVRVEGNEFCYGGAEPGVVSAEGTVYLPGSRCFHGYVAISEDEGRTWTQVMVDEREVWTNSLGVDDEGNLYYAFIPVDDPMPYFSISRDGGTTWSSPMMVAHPRVREAYQVTVDVRRSGRIALAYMGSENSDRRSYDGETTWNGYVTVSNRALAANPVFYSANVNPAGDPLMVGRCGPVNCGPNLDFIDVLIGPDGQPRAAFVDGCVPGNCPTFSDRDLGIEGVVATLEGGPKL